MKCRNALNINDIAIQKTSTSNKQLGTQFHLVTKNMKFQMIQGISNFNIYNDKRKIKGKT